MPKHISDEQLLTALLVHGGVAKAATALSMSRTAIYKRLQDDAFRAQGRCYPLHRLQWQTGLMMPSMRCLMLFEIKTVLPVSECQPLIAFYGIAADI